MKTPEDLGIKLILFIFHFFIRCSWPTDRLTTSCAAITASESKVSAKFFDMHIKGLLSCQFLVGYFDLSLFCVDCWKKAESRIMEFISYSLYLYNELGFLFFDKLLTGFLIIFVQCAPLSYYLIVQPSRSLGAKFASKVAIRYFHPRVG